MVGKGKGWLDELASQGRDVLCLWVSLGDCEIAVQTDKGRQAYQSANEELKGDLYVEQISVELVTRLHSRECRTDTLDNVASLGSAGLGLLVLEGKGPITSNGEDCHWFPWDRPGDVTRADQSLDSLDECAQAVAEKAPGRLSES